MVKWLLRKCDNCGRYTLNESSCPYCGGKVHIPHPAKFSLDDKYLKYRTMRKSEHEDVRQGTEECKAEKADNA
jgi:H/ACA ribonucleoprotein complex subunit 3